MRGLVLLLLVGLLTACPEEKRQPPPGYPLQPGYPPYPTTSAPPMTTAPPAPTPMPLPVPIPPPGEGSDATRINPMSVMASAGPTLKLLQQSDMVGLLPDGPSIAGQFQAGQKLVTMVELVPGRCYGAIGHGMGITELDLAIVLGDAPVEYTMAADTTNGPNAVIGPRGNCVVNTLPVADEGKLVITARTGNGAAVAHLFSR